MRPIYLFIVFACIAGAAAACGGATELEHPKDRPAQANQDVDWRDQVIYQIVVDRFSNGNPNNDYNVEPSIPGRYHGGDWQGIIDQLDYLEALGVTALWISPVVKNTEEDAGFASYHGYWTQDFLRTNPHFGSLLELRELVDEAHARGMLVLLDVVTNHVGQLFYYDINGNGQPDDWLQGGGRSHTCVQICDQTPNACSEDEQTYCREGADYLERIIEWDPEYDPRGIQAWTSLGFSGPAPIRFPNWPEQNRVVPPRPPDWFDWPSEKAWFDDPAWYNRRGRVYVWWRESSYSREFVREQEVYGDFPGGLKDLNTDNPDVQDALFRIFAYWIEVADFDGFRIDTAKHIDRPEINPNVRGFWGDFTTRIREFAAARGKHNFFMFGEAFDGNDELLGAYTMAGQDERGRFGRFDGVFYFSQKYRGINPVFMDDAPTKNLACLYYSRMGIAPPDTWCADNGYPRGPTYESEPHAASAEGGTGLAPQQTLVTFLDNHDLPRFLFEKDDVEALKNALFFLMTWDGIPCLYYGTEQLFAGGVDPANREDLWRGNPRRGFSAFDTSHDFFAYVQALIQMRKELTALRRGKVTIRWATDAAVGEADHGIFAFERSSEEQRLLVVINASDAPSETCSLPSGCMRTSFSPGTVLLDVSPGGGGTFTVSADATLRMTMPPRGSRVLVPQP